MGVQLIDNGTYQRRAFTIPAESVYTIDFNGQNPNFYRLNNMGDVTLYCATNNYPTNKLYDFKANPLSIGNFTEPAYRDHLYIYNPANKEVDIILVSWASEFDPTYMAVSEISLNNEGVVETDGIIKGFTASLPNGSNNIGNVNVSNLKDYETLLNNIKTALTNINTITAGNQENTDIIRGAINSLMQELTNVLNSLNYAGRNTAQITDDIQSKVDDIFNILEDSEGTSVLVSILNRLKIMSGERTKERKIIQLPLGDGAVFDDTYDISAIYPGYYFEKFITVSGNNEQNYKYKVFYAENDVAIINEGTASPGSKFLPIDTFNDIERNTKMTSISIQADNMSKYDSVIFQIAKGDE